MNNNRLIETKTCLKDFKSDIDYSIKNEDSSINVTKNDIKRIDFVLETIDVLEKDYERLYNKIIGAIHYRIKEIGKDNIEDDEIIQFLQAIIKSENEYNV